MVALMYQADQSVNWLRSLVVVEVVEGLTSSSSLTLPRSGPVKAFLLEERDLFWLLKGTIWHSRADQVLKYLHVLICHVYLS